MYSAAWDGKPVEIFVGRLESPESRPFGLAGAEVLAISSLGEAAVSLNRHAAGGFRRSGTLARVSIAGGAPPGTSWRMSSGRTGRRMARISPSFGRSMAKSGSSIPIGKVL